jgi:4'-phosphopantetheinyl transferase EntD
LIDTLFPPEVVTVTADEAMWSGALHPEEEALLRDAVAKRRREFTAGRLCARTALARLGIEHPALLMDADRVPVWPPGVIGSLSHCEGYCGAVVARRGELLGIGLDVELAGPLPPGVPTAVLTPGEATALARLPALRGADWAKLAFCAKESLYKCLFPLTRTFLEFTDVEIAVDAARGTFVARPAPGSPLAPERVAGLEGRFAFAGRFVFSGATLRAPGSRG